MSLTERIREIKRALGPAVYLGVVARADKQLADILAMPDDKRQKKRKKIDRVVSAYLRVLRDVSSLERKDHRDAVHRTAVERLNGLIPILPDHECEFRAFLGVSYQELGKMRDALGNYEQSLMLHPNPESENSSFPGYKQNYVSCARLITQNAVPHIHGRGKEQSIQDLILVANSTARVLVRYGNLKEVYRENHAAFSWLQKAGVQPKTVIQRGIMQGPN